MSLNSKVRAFTLLECLVALLVIAGSVQVLSRSDHSIGEQC